MPSVPPWTFVLVVEHGCGIAAHQYEMRRRRADNGYGHVATSWTTPTMPRLGLSDQNECWQIKKVSGTLCGTAVDRRPVDLLCLTTHRSPTRRRVSGRGSNLRCIFTPVLLTFDDGLTCDECEYLGDLFPAEVLEAGTRGSRAKGTGRAIGIPINRSTISRASSAASAIQRPHAHCPNADHDAPEPPKPYGPRYGPRNF
jgi:hypothetical protein